MLRNILEHHPATCKGKCIRYQNHVSPFRNFISPGKAAVIFLLMFLHQWMLLVRRSCDLSCAKIFVSAMIMKSKYAWQPAPGINWFQQDSFSWTAIWQLPAKFFYMQTIINVLFPYNNLWSTSNIRNC